MICMATGRAYALAASLSLFLLTGCLMSPEHQEVPDIAILMPAPDIDLATLKAPTHLDGFHFDGDASQHQPPRRLLRYLRSDDGAVVNLSLYPFPGGWDTMTPARAIAAHYGQQRERLDLRALQQNGTLPEWDHEALLPRDGAPYPLFQGIQRLADGPLKLMVGAQAEVFYVAQTTSAVSLDTLAHLLSALMAAQPAAPDL